MVDVSAIAGTVSALKGAMDITKAMVGLRDAQAMQTKVIELNSKILEAQSSAFAANDERSVLIEQVRQLEKEMADLKAWDAEKQRYELKEVAPGAIAYVPNESMRGSEPMHFLCANCYQNHKKRFLQAHRRDHSFDYYKCQECGGEIRIPRPPKPPLEVRNTRRYDPYARR